MANNNEPWYDCEDIWCSCTGCGIESQWEWSEEQGCYICNGCGDAQ